MEMKDLDVPVHFWQGADGSYHAEVAELAGCSVVRERLEDVLPMLRLAVERSIAALLAAGEELPAFADRAECPLAIHIHLGHLQALVRHQQRGAGAGSVKTGTRQ